MDGSGQWQGLAGWMDTTLGSDSGVLGIVLDSLVVVLIFLVVRRVLRRALLRNVDDPARRYVVGKFVSYSLGTVAVLILMNLWIADDANIGAWIGLTSAGLAIALRDPIVNVAGWLFIAARQPFSIGDRVQIGDVAGDVVDVGIWTFSLLEIGNWVNDDQSTGRIIHLPNGVVFSKAIASYTQGFDHIWNEIGVTVTFESDWQKARTVLTEIVWAHSAGAEDAMQEQLKNTAPKYMVHYTHLTPIVWVTVVDIGVRLDIRYLCPARRRRSSASQIWSDVLTRFSGEPGIDFAYPTQRFFDARAEAKPGMRATDATAQHTLTPPPPTHPPAAR
jgi:small-conductance mechanosensitive channel